MRKPDLPTSLTSGPDDLHSKAAHPATTGRYIVVFREGAVEKGVELLESFGLRLELSPESGESSLREDEVGDVDVIVFRRLGVALVAGAPTQINQLIEAVNYASSRS